MNSVKRYVVTLDAYAYARSDEEAKELAKHLAYKLKEDDNRAGVISIHEVPFGTVEQAREVNKN